MEKFSEAKATAKVLMEERKKETQEQDKPQLPAGSSSLSPTASSPAAVKSPPPTSPPSVNGHPEGAGRKISNGSGEETLRVANGPPTQQEVAQLFCFLYTCVSHSIALTISGICLYWLQTASDVYKRIYSKSVPPPLLQSSSPALGRTGSNATPEAQLESLKYENNRLKVALASR